jgi:hypothetical protein
MEDGKAEGEKKSTHLNESGNQNVRAIKQTVGPSKVGKKRNHSKKGHSNTCNENGHRDSPKEQHWRPKQPNSATLLVISEAPNDKEQENGQLIKQKKKSQQKNQNGSGSRSEGRESRRNELSNKEKTRVKRDFTKVKSD